MVELLICKAIPNYLPEDFFPVLIDFAKQTNHADLAKHLTVKSYFPTINCNDLDQDTVKSIIEDSEALEAYQQIYQIVTNDCSNNASLLANFGTDVLESIIELAEKYPAVKNLFKDLDNTCPFVREFEKFLTNISHSPQFYLELEKVQLLIDLCETMGWETDKLTFEKIKKNLESDRPSPNPELGL